MKISKRSPRFSCVDTSPEQLTTLAGIEQAVRKQMQKHVMPQVGIFLLQQLQVQPQAPDVPLKASAGVLPLTSQQAQELGVRSHTQLSPYLEMCCLRVSANVSYQHAEEDVELFTGITVAAKTQQRLVHRQAFEMPQVKQSVEELSVDGGKIRIRTPQGESCMWKEYKGVCLHDAPAIGAFFQDNDALTKWVNDQPLASPVTCLGDGHDGVWNIIVQIAPNGERLEILDWYHLMENLHKVGGSLKRLRQAETLLWQGSVSATRALFADLISKQAQNFCSYLDKHKNHIVNYQYYQAEQICSIGSGAVESAVKQIDRRTKISGVQWKQENVPQVLAQRCAYLNGLLSV